MVFSYYGKIIITITTIIILLILVFSGISYDGNKGILSIVGSSFEKKEENFDNMDDNKSIEEYNKKTLPVISSIYEYGDIKENVPINVTNLFRATASDLSDISNTIKVTNLTDTNSNIVTDFTYNKETNELTFSKEGTYRIYLSAHDSYNKVTQKMFIIFVV